MADEQKKVLAIIAFFLLLLALKPGFIGTTAGSIGLQDFENIWIGFGLAGQMFIVLIVFIVIISLAIGGGEK